MINSLAINILTHNGASSFLREAIKAVESFSDEITILDNGSTDDTKKIIKKEFPDVYIESLGEPEIHNKAYYLNTLKECTKAPWILRIDDDEIFPKETMEEIMQLDEQVPVYTIPFLHYEDGHFVNPSHHRKSAFYVARLFRNILDMTWVRKEEVLAYGNKPVSSRGNQPHLCRKIKNPFLHFGQMKKGRDKNYYSFHKKGHCEMPLGKYEKYVPNQD